MRLCLNHRKECERRLQRLLVLLLFLLLPVIVPARADATTAFVSPATMQAAPDSAAQTGAAVTLTVDTTAEQHTISPYIYGINFGDEERMAALNIPLRRSGGNATSRYNWQLDASNRASDWFFESLPGENDNPGALPDGSSSDRFVEENRAHGAQSIITAPLLGWTAKSRERTCSYSVKKYGKQQAADYQWQPDCGNGILQDGTPITWNDPEDANVAIGPAFVRDWIYHLTGKYGRAKDNGVRFYSLDNEPMLWHETHRDVHPEPATYDEVRDRGFEYGATIRAADPGAQILGPALWGWTAYFYSAADAAAGGSWWNNPPDRSAHGDTPFVEWYLQQMRAYEQQHGSRILDYLDLHYYPQAAGVTLAPAGDSATRARRLRSTRSLWDPSYADESWIGEPVMLVPRMRQWVDENYPGTKLAITEYNFGGHEHINGALAQADVLGIFGRERLDLATLWDPPEANEPAAFAFRIYRNYDGQNSTFGERSLAATSSDREKVAIYAARRAADGALIVVVVNKSGSAQTVDLQLSGLSENSAAAVYRYSPADLSRIVQLAGESIAAGGLQTTLPADSITLYELTPETSPNPPAPPPPAVNDVAAHTVFLPLTIADD